MKIPRLTLYGQILMWLFLNLALVAGVLFLVLHVQFKVGLWSLLSGQVNQRIEAIGAALSAELREVARSEWPEIVSRYDETYGATFSVLRLDGEQVLAGAGDPLPEKLTTLLKAELPRREGPPGRAFNERGPRRGDDRGNPQPPLRPTGDNPPPVPAGLGRGAPPRVVFYEKDPASGRHWVAMIAPLRSRAFRHPPEVVLVASAAGLDGNSVFFDWRPWAWALIGIVLVSALIWFPFVHRVSHRLGKLTAAAESISEGDFAVEVASSRADELGRLSRAVQAMASRLDEYVTGQKRFLGDIAHELCSPLVRTRMALGILEQELSPADAARLESVNEEVEELSQLVNELLDFSRASLKPNALPRHPVPLAELVQEVIRREAGAAGVVSSVGGDLVLHSNPELLRRALGNVLRNAVRYSEGRGAIEVQARRQGAEIVLAVLDRGPGVPEEWLTRIFEPFSRPENARTREGGGAGLGLAIARTCTEALGGSLRGSNRPGGGFAAEFRFPSNP